MLTLNFREAQDSDMFDVLDIRNESRQYMTHHTEEITPEQQYDWWMTKDINEYRIWLVTSEYRGTELIIGFCMIRLMPNGYEWGTLAVYEQFRGLGIGTAIYEFMASKTDQLWIEVRNDNIASLRAAMKAGFTIQYTGDLVTTLVKDNSQ